MSLMLLLELRARFLAIGFSCVLDIRRSLHFALEHFVDCWDYLLPAIDAVSLSSVPLYLQYIPYDPTSPEHTTVHPQESPHVPDQSGRKK